MKITDVTVQCYAWLRPKPICGMRCQPKIVGRRGMSTHVISGIDNALKWLEGQ